MKAPVPLKKILIKILKITGWIVVSIILLLVAAILAIRIPSVQNKVTQKAVSFLKDKIKTEVTIGLHQHLFPEEDCAGRTYLKIRRKILCYMQGR